MSYFEAHILLRENPARQQKGWKLLERMTSNRRLGWVESALELVTDHPLAEIIDIIDWVFASRDGQLPASAVETKRDLKLTRLRQIQRGWDDLVQAIAGHAPATAPAIHKIDAKDLPVTHTPQQSQVDDLVELFRDFRSGVVTGSGRDTDIADARARSWAKTFRIMLAKESFDDIKAVIDAVRECPEEVDQRQYSNAYDLNRPGEWEILQGLVRIHESIKAEEAARPHVAPAPRANDDAWLDDDDDDDWRPPHPRFRRKDPVESYPDHSPRIRELEPKRLTSTDMSSVESIERRRARYAGTL